MGKKLKGKPEVAKTIVKSQPDNTVSKSEKEIKDKKIEMHMAAKKAFVGIAEQIAEDDHHQLNWYYPEYKEVFPRDKKCQYVGKMYPHAKGGKLLVDEPRFEHEMAHCRLKQRELKKLGYRYLIITPEMTIEQARLELNHVVDNSERRVENITE